MGVSLRPGLPRYYSSHMAQAVAEGGLLEVMRYVPG